LIEQKIQETREMEMIKEEGIDESMESGYFLPPPNPPS
jgi:hypothetical protein